VRNFTLFDVRGLHLPLLSLSSTLFPLLLFCFTRISSKILCTPIIGPTYLKFFRKKRHIVEEICECHFRVNKLLSPIELSLHRTTDYYV